MPKKSASKRSGWKDTKKNHKHVKNLKLGLAVLGLVLTIIVVGQFINLFKTITNPLDFYSERKYSWDGKFNIYVVIQTDQLALLNFNPQGREASLILIPKDAHLDVAGGYGDWMPGSIFALGESSEKGLGQKLVKYSVSSLFGIPVDGFISLEGEYNAKEFVELLRQNPVSGLDLFSKIRSDMTPIELISLKFGLMKIRFDKINYIDLSLPNLYDTQTLPDGTNIKKFDPVKLDSILTDFEDPKVREENLSIAVFNATNYPQLAQKAKRIITNLGGNVIIVSNYPQEIKNTIILGEESDTLKRLTQIFSSCLSKKCDRISPHEISSSEVSSRAQINIFLGEDFAKLW